MAVELPDNIGEGDVLEGMIGDLFTRVLALDFSDGQRHFPDLLSPHVALHASCLADGSEQMRFANVETQDFLTIIRPSDTSTPSTDIAHALDGEFEPSQQVPKVLFRILAEDMFDRPYLIHLEGKGEHSFQKKFFELCNGQVRQYIAEEGEEESGVIILRTSWGSENYEGHARDIANMLDLATLVGGWDFTPERIIGEQGTD